MCGHGRKKFIFQQDLQECDLRIYARPKMYDPERMFLIIGINYSKKSRTKVCRNHTLQGPLLRGSFPFLVSTIKNHELCELVCRLSGAIWLQRNIHNVTESALFHVSYFRKWSLADVSCAFAHFAYRKEIFSEQNSTTCRGLVWE